MIKRQHTVPSVPIKYPVVASQHRIKVSIIFTEHLNLCPWRINTKNMSCNRMASLNKVGTTRNFVWFVKKSVNAKPFLVRTIFCTHQNFCKRYETSKIPSTSFRGCKNFVRRENPLFLDIHPSLGRQILQHNYLRSERDRMTSRECSISH